MSVRDPAKVGDVAALVDAVERRFGLRFHRGYHTVLAENAFRLIGNYGVRSLADVTFRVSSADENDPVVHRLREAASIGETYFFRGHPQLRALEAWVLDHLAPVKRAQGQHSLRIWSAGCATGEEVYTLAMMFSESLPDFQLQILGTDMNDAALKAARQGSYRLRAFRGTPPEGLKWIRREGDRLLVHQELRRKVSFQTLNLVHDAVPDPAAGLVGFDVVLCRNVLIYIEAPSIPVVVRKLAAACAPSAIVALTAAEYSAGRHLDDYLSLGNGLWTRMEQAEVKVVVPPPLLTVESGAPAAQPTSIDLAPVSDPAPASDRSPLDAEELMTKARAAADRGELQAAEKLLESALRLRPDWPLAHYLFGQVARAVQRPEQARLALQRALFFDRTFAAAEIALGELEGSAGRLSAGLRHFQRALSLLLARADDEVVEGVNERAGLVRRFLYSAMRSKDAER